MPAIQFNPERRFVRPVGELLRRVVPVLDVGIALKKSIQKVGQAHSDTTRLKVECGISSAIVEWRFAVAIERLQLAVSKIDAWIDKARAGESNGAINLLVDSAHLLREGEQLLQESTQCQWLGDIAQELDDLAAAIQEQGRRSEALSLGVDKHASPQVKASTHLRSDDERSKSR